jgi:outer membrane protein assembly factor BamB
VPLPRFVDGQAKKGQIFWRGPVLAGDRLIAVGSDGSVHTISPYSGKPLGRIELRVPILIPPIVADQTLYILTDDGTLHAYR